MRVRVIDATLSMVFDVNQPEMRLAELYREAEERLAVEAWRLGFLPLARPRARRHHRPRQIRCDMRVAAPDQPIYPIHEGGPQWQQKQQWQ